MMSHNLKNAMKSYGKVSVFLFLIIIVPVFFTACQSAAQRKVEWLQAEEAALKQRDRVCYKNIKTRYEKDRDILSYMEPWMDSDTSNGSKGYFDGGNKIPTDYEVKIIIGIYNDIAHCRAEMIEGLTRINPDMVPIYVQSYRASDLNMTELIERKISWREAQEKKLALDQETDKRIRDEMSRLQKELETIRYDDPANRRADVKSDSAAALIQSKQQEALSEQIRNQRLIDRPPVCTKVGDMHYCR
jgi:inorganic triphosphatase YgiF